MDTTFGKIAVEARFKIVNVVADKVLPNAYICTKVKPFEFQAGRPKNNYIYTNSKGRLCSGTLSDGDKVVLESFVLQGKP